MKASIRVRPARPDLHVPNPDRRRLLLSEGEVVPESPYWLRRIARGEVVVLEAETPAPERQTKPRPKE